MDGLWSNYLIACKENLKKSFSPKMTPMMVKEPEAPWNRSFCTKDIPATSTVTNRRNESTAESFWTTNQRICLISRPETASEEVVKSLQFIGSAGRKQYKNYVKDVIEDSKVSIHETIKKNSFPLFRRQKPKPHTKTKQQVTALRSDYNLFSRQYIATQHWSGDLSEFFMHENQLNHIHQLSLSWENKFDLLTWVKLAEYLDLPSSYTAKIFDGAALVHALPVTTVSTFGNYADNIVIPVNHLQSAKRVDVVWDIYKESVLTR